MPITGRRLRTMLQARLAPAPVLYPSHTAGGSRLFTSCRSPVCVLFLLRPRSSRFRSPSSIRNRRARLPLRHSRGRRASASARCYACAHLARLPACLARSPEPGHRCGLSLACCSHALLICSPRIRCQQQAPSRSISLPTAPRCLIIDAPMSSLDPCPLPTLNYFYNTQILRHNALALNSGKNIYCLRRSAHPDAQNLDPAGTPFERRRNAVGSPLELSNVLPEAQKKERPSERSA